MGSKTVQMPNQQMWGGFWTRFLAYVIDSAIIFIPNTLITRGAAAMLGQDQGSILGLVVSMFFELFYFGIL